MESKVEKISSEVLKKSVPKSEEREKVYRLTRDVKRRVLKYAKRVNLSVEVEVGGSVAKDTWLSGEADIDILMLVDKDLMREEFERVCIDVARRASEDWIHKERFAEHPYLEVFVDNILINIVPCYRVKLGEWRSSADRTPFHTRYIKKHFSKGMKNEVRLLKRFMKGVGVYGAEIRIGGFSGYLCEVLILNYGSFIKTLEEASKWRDVQVIDVENHYKGRIVDLQKIFKTHIIAADPVDRNRNVAASVTLNKFYEFIAASNFFLSEPKETFFYPPKITPISPNELRKVLKSRGSDIILLIFEVTSHIPDILWGQLSKSLKSIINLLNQYNFNIIHSSVWSDEKNINVFVFELESTKLSLSRKHIGPPIWIQDSKRFLQKYLLSNITISGPRIEEGRWVVEIFRKYPNAVSLIREKVKNDGKSIGIAEGFVNSIKKTLKICENNDIIDFYSSNADFSKFMTEFLEGKPRWLESFK